MIKFENTYTKLPSDFYEVIAPEKFSNPTLIAINRELASQLSIDLGSLTDQEIASVFSGQTILPGSTPIALAYAGMQFGHPVPQLGDGRAHLLGEVAGYDIQLKGSGRTRFSRRGDGRSALGPVLREYIVSEAMHTLGVPTTRALCAVATGETVTRQDGDEPGGIFTRVAASHLRVGTFQYFAFQGDVDSIEVLLDYAIKRHYPDLLSLDSSRDKALEFIKTIISKQADLVAKWSSLGFIHGVMNTDNFSVAGITIDYGPCAFMDEFKFNKTFSSIDRNGRYSYWNQAAIAKWNVARLAECLLPLIDSDTDQAVSVIEQEILPLLDQFDERRIELLAKKLGISNYTKNDSRIVSLFLNYLEEHALDFTLAFRNLTELYSGDSSFYPTSEKLDEFLQIWKERLVDNHKLNQSLNQVNPLYIPRNHQVQKAIDQAYKGDYQHFHRLVNLLKNPYEEQANRSEFALGPNPSERVYQTFCGT